jgi:hypothetical protein
MQQREQHAEAGANSDEADKDMDQGEGFER